MTLKQSILGRVRLWLLAALVISSSILSLLPTIPAVAAPGDPGDANGIWVLKDILKYDGRTYVNQYTQQGGNDVYAPPNTPKCDDANNIFSSYLKILNDTSAELYSTNRVTSPTGVTSCDHNLIKSVPLTSPSNRSILFYREGDTIHPFNNSATFTKIEAKGGAAEVFANGRGACVDIIVRQATLNAAVSDWYIFVMDPTSIVQSNFAVSAGSISEAYARYTDTQATSLNDCRVNSLKLSNEPRQAYALVGVPTNDVTFDAEGNDLEACGKYASATPLVVDMSKINMSISQGPIPGFNTDIPRYVTKCRSPSSDHTIFTYATTVTDSNRLINYPGFDGNIFDDDGYKISAGVAAEAPDATPIKFNVSPTGQPGSASAGLPTRICADEIGGLGFVLCPLLGIFDTVVRWAFTNFINPFLTVPPLTNVGGLREAWQQILIIANIVFVVIFFVIIFSQATSIGVSNYGIKTLLPRLIAVAILANISFYLCVFAVDFSNALSAGITSLLAIPLSNLPSTTISFDRGDFLGALGGFSLVGAAVATQGLLGTIAAVAIPAIIALLVTVLALIVRMVLIMAFVMFSPLIFMGFILPGTSRLAGRLTMGFLNLLWAGTIVLAFLALSNFVIYIIELVVPE